MLNRYANFPSTNIAVYPQKAGLKGMLIRLNTDHLHHVWQKRERPGGGYEEKLLTYHLKRGTVLRVFQITMYGCYLEMEVAKYGPLHTGGTRGFHTGPSMRDKKGRVAIMFNFDTARLNIDQRLIKILKDHPSRIQ
jgi:hypothetical protein